MIKKIGNKTHNYNIVICPCGCKLKRLVRNDRILKGQTYVKGHYFYNNGLSFNKLRNRWVIMDRDNRPTPYSRAIVESVLKRELKFGEIVHHINNDSSRDSKNNLLVCLKDYHNFLHGEMRKHNGPWTKDRSYLTV